MAGVIRRENFASTTPFSFRDIESEAARIIEQARAEAERVLAAAREQAVRDARDVREQQRREGFAQGQAEGLAAAREEAARSALAAARKQLDSLAATLATAAEQVDRNKHNLLAQAETELIQLAMAIARRVCKTEAVRTSDTACQNARQVLEQAAGEHDPVLHVHPDELDTLRATLPQVAGHLEQIEHVEIVADESVERGGCVLHTREGTVDGTLDAQLDAVASALVAGGES